MLIRQPESLNESYGAIKKKIDADYSANQSIWQIYWTEATIDTRLEAGDTSLMADLNQSLPNNNRGSWYFNRVRPLCNMVSGYQRRNRKSTVVVPLENGDQQTADQWSKILLNVYKREGVYETISEAFHQGGCIAGMNLLHVYMDYRNDPVSGDLKVDNCSYNSFFIDPYFRKPDLSDCSFVWRRSYLSHSAAAALMPDRYEEIMSLPGNPTGTGRDGRFQYMPESYGQTQQNRLAYDEYYYRDYRKQKLLIDKMTGETFEITNQNDIDVDDNKMNKKKVSESLKKLNEDSHKDTQWPNGSFVKVKDKCNEFPYCDEGPDAIETKKSKNSVISRDIYEQISEKTGLSVESVIDIISRNKKEYKKNKNN